MRLEMASLLRTLHYLAVLASLPQSQYSSIGSGQEDRARHIPTRPVAAIHFSLYSGYTLVYSVFHSTDLYLDYGRPHSTSYCSVTGPSTPDRPVHTP